MASLYFYFSSMDSGKSTYLLQSAHNYESAGKRVLVLTPGIDDRYGMGKVTSRIGLQKEALAISARDDLLEQIGQQHKENRLSCIMIDESQFLSEQQVWQLSNVVDQLGIPVLCFGLRTDAFGEAFPGSKVLLAIADELCEIKSICKKCEKKASMQVRLDGGGNVVKSGNVVQIGGNDSYLSVCRKHYKALMAD
ncbi:thymidine kinase [Endozoicomonas sp. OPT23]|uniref:thymidine kinase n=1 Tax=Endozoicomonas sp. OPT23 TaxID=2072845 RepID=UPI00129A35C0|nr:thymidine kinase [Endozoicomonas sp. OPT23]MRI34656.1 thymidine kinase [Endozoicomonas sp. OPT23]